MERGKASILKSLLIALADLILIVVTVVAADAAENYILNTFGFLPSLTYSFIGLFAALMFTFFLFRLDSPLLKAMGLSVPFTAFYLFLRLVVGDGSMIPFYIIISGAGMMTFLKLKKKSLLYSISILLIMSCLILLEVSGADLIELMRDSGFSLY